MNTRLVPATVLVALLFGATAVSAQAPTRSPHEQLPTELSCTACHTSDAWSPLRVDLEFDHFAETGFSLDGQHGEASCVACHEDLTFAEIGSRQDDCGSCHLDVHLGTPTRPCVACHTTDSFRQLPLGVVHPADFPLEGAHLQITCEGCHTDDLGGAFSPPERECTSCHLGDYLSVPLVDHQALGFSTNCIECHSTLDFRDVPFDHFTFSGGFDLRGEHAGLECTACHSGPGGNVPGSPTGTDDCVACHLPDYQEEHGGSGYPTDCLACHAESTWDGAVFDHLTVSGFELLTPHTSLDCVFCHVGSTSETLFSPSGPGDCYACHLDDYQAEHGGTGFSTDCTACHQLDTWDGATFDHAFPITSGPHGGLDCSECHEVPGDFAQFTCTSACHHTPSRTNDQHSDVNGYSYDSPSCLSCHPIGRS